MKKLAYYLLFYFLMNSALAPGQSIPAITTFSPSSGPVGTTVTITGSNFGTMPAENTVFFGVTKATVNSATASQLNVSVPIGATYSPITVTVNGLTAYSNSSFIVTFPFSGTIGASFASRTDFWAGYLTKSGAVSDLDGDGKTDMIAVDQVGNMVSVFRNVSTPDSITLGSFAPKVDFATGFGPYAVATGDLDGDGKLDLVVANYDGGSVSIFMNTSTPGTISFSPGVEFGTVGTPDFVAINDLDLDGKSDIAVACSNFFGEGFVSILRNTSTVGSISSDSFAPRVDFSAAHGGIWCVRLDDVDGDGKGDITVTNGGDALVSIFRNISTPGSITSSSFDTKVDLTLGAPGAAYPGLISLADLDGDQKPELVVGSGNTVALFRNISSPGIINTGSFDARVDLAVGDGPWNPAPGDLDGDGKLDLIVRDASHGTLLIFKNISSPGTLSAASFSPPSHVETGGNSLSIFVGDMDGDGKADLTVSNEWTNVMSVFRNADIFEPSPGESVPAIASFSPTNGPAGIGVTITGTNFSPTAADNAVYFGATKANINSATASQLDVSVPIGATYQPITVSPRNGLSAYSRSPFIVTFPFSGSIGASFATRTDFWAGTQARWETVQDLDGDGKTDIVVADEASNVVSILRNVSTPGSISWYSFQPKVDFATGPGPYAVATGDLDGDGKPDLVVTNSGGTSISIFRNTSAPGAISFSPGIEFEAVAGPVFVAIQDLDLDGKPDVAVTSTNFFGEGIVSIFRNTSTVGSFSSASFAPRVDFTAGNGGVWCVVLGDVDGDGKSDMTVTSGGDSLVSIFRNISTPGSITSGSFEAKVDFATGAYPSIAFLADLDGDHKPDLAVGNAGGNTLSIFRNISSPGFISSASFNARVDLDSPGGPWNPIAGDLDGDGKLDLIVRNGTNATLLIFKNLSSAGMISPDSFSPPYTVETGGNSLGISIGDMDGDGKADITLSSESTNVVSVLRNADILPPSPPIALPASFVSNTGFEAEWNRVNGISEYHLDVSTSDTFSSFVSGYEDKVIYPSDSGTVRSTVAGLLPKTNYFYRVRAAGIPGNSLTIQVKTLANPLVSSTNVWANRYGGDGDEEIQTMTSDEKGNVYAAGHFSGTIKIGSKTLTSKGDFDIFFVRFDPKGKVVWARSIGGPALDNEVSLATDSKGLYMTAQFAGDIDVDPGAGTTLFTNEGQWYVNDGFFARYDLSDGSLDWAHNLVDAATWASSSIGVDKTGVYVAGHYSGAVDFDPGRGVALLTSQGADDVFLAKYSLKGKYIWAGSMGGYSWDSAFGLLVDATGVYINGSYGSPSDFDPTSNFYLLDGSGGFFGRYDLTNGHLKYIKNVGNGLIWGLDNNGRDLYICGESRGSFDADPDAGTQMIGTDGFGGGIIGKYNLLDGSYRWAKSLVTTGWVGPRRVLADGSGAYLSGYFGGSVDFDGGTGSANRTSVGGDAFSAHYDARGGLDWAKGIGSPGFATSIAATLTDDAYYMGGLFGNTVNFDPYKGNVTLTSDSGSTDIFIARYRLTKKVKKDHNEHDLFTSNEELRTTNLFPNPAESILRIDWQGFDNDEPIDVRILDLFGRALITRAMSTEDNAIDVSDLSPGYHIFQARQNDVNQILRFIKK